MALAVLFALTVVGAGYAVLRISRVGRGAQVLGLTCPVGLAVLTSVSGWCMLTSAVPPVPALAVFGVALVGLGLAVVDRRAIVVAVRAVVVERPVAAATLAAALMVPLIAMGFAFAGVVVPLSPHDGAAHVEAIQAYRLGQAWTDWGYPPGTRTLMAGWLQGLPWVDTAEGAFDVGMSLPLLAALAVFGLGVSVWRNLEMAAAGALLLSLTYVYPYFPEIWSGWPLAMSLVLVVGVWAVSLDYVRGPSARAGAVAGLLLGGIVLVHGSELYSLIVILAVVLLGSLRGVVWRYLPRDLAIAAGLALLCAAPYLPILFHWVGSGGTGYGLVPEDGQVPQEAPGLSGPSDLFVVFGLGALGIDVPVRVVLLAIGAVAAFRLRSGRSVVVIGLVFLAITSSFSVLGGIPLLQRVYNATFPWGMSYRIFMVVAIAQALLAGAGGVVLLSWLARLTRGATAWQRRWRRMTRLVVVTWLLLTTWSLVLFLAYPAGLVLGYSADDAAAMDWLRQHAMVGSVVVNDGFADAGIWSPYKAGLPVLLTRSASADEVTTAALVIDNVARLDQMPAAAAVVCSRHAEYVFRGARVSGWDARRFPELDVLRASAALEPVFASGEATVFRIRIGCRSD